MQAEEVPLLLKCFIFKFVCRSDPREGSHNFNCSVDNLFIILVTVVSLNPICIAWQTREQGIDI